MRLYGRATVQPSHESPYADALLGGNAGPTKNVRQVIVLDVGAP